MFLISVGLLFLIFFLRIATLNENKLFIIILIALLFHLCLLIFVQFDINRYYSPEVAKSRFFNDGEAYSSNALIISNTLKGIKTVKNSFRKIPGVEFVSDEVLDAANKSNIVPPVTYEVGYITYFYSIIYAAYGYAPAFLNFININFHLLTALLIFFICSKNFNRATAYIATILFLFWPTIFFYSTTKLKEPMLTFLFYLLILIWMSVKNKRVLIFFTILLLVCIEMLRKNFFQPMLLIIFVYIWLKIVTLYRPLLKLSIILTGAFVIIRWQWIYNILVHSFRLLADRHLGFLSSGGAIYSLIGVNDNILNYSLLDWLFYTMKGWYHLIFEPLFTTNISFSFLVFYPFKIFLILFLVLGFLGVLYRISQNKTNNFILVGFFLTYGTIFALTEGNTGTMLRHRDLIIPVVFIYGAYFISEILKKSRMDLK